jgi:hypothetical protein
MDRSIIDAALSRRRLLWKQEELRSAPVSGEIDGCVEVSQRCRVHYEVDSERANRPNSPDSGPQASERSTTGFFVCLANSIHAHPNEMDVVIELGSKGAVSPVTMGSHRDS